ncbi:MAG TPA: cytochrome c3 family protein, partial [Noviherbaspirillum sp.]
MSKYAKLSAIGALLLAMAALLPAPSLAQTKGAMPKDPETVAQVRAWNAQCLQCHIGDSLHGQQGKGLFALPGNAAASTRTSPKFAASNHGGMACKTCHVGAFIDYPHTAAEGGRKAETLQCDECHAQEFSRIEKQVAKSVHSKNLADIFTCSTCHDPHVVATAKKLGSVQKVVAQDNAMCLDCH